jgi:hypothetical protein
MHTSELREHRIDCVRNRLRGIQAANLTLHLHPKDPDPYPNFMIGEVGLGEVRFRKLSSSQEVVVELRKVAEIVVSEAERLADIRLLGRVTWQEDAGLWRFVTTRAGRPATETQTLQAAKGRFEHAERES